MKHDATISRRRGATPRSSSRWRPPSPRRTRCRRAQAPAKKVLTVEDYPKWRTHQRPGDFRRRQLGRLRPGADQHGRHRIQAGAAHRPGRDQPAHRGAERDRRRVLGRLEMDRLPGRSDRRTRRPRRRGRRDARDRAVAGRRYRGAAERARRRAAREPGAGDDAAGTESADDADAAARSRRRRTTPPRSRAGDRPRRATPPATPAGDAGTRAGAGRAGGTRRARRPRQPTRVELRNLATGAIKSWQDIQSFAFSPTSTHLILKRRPATAGGAARRRGAAAAAARRRRRAAAGAGRGGAATPAGPRGADVILHNLVTGRDQLLGSVGDIAFNKAGDLLAYTVDAAVKDGNGLFVLDLQDEPRCTRSTTTPSAYNRLTWSDDGTALAVLKGADVEKMRERDNVLLAFANVAGGARRTSRPTPVAARSGEGRRVPEGLGRQRSRGARLERRQQARLLRRQGAGAGARHGARAAAPTSSPTWTSGTRPTSASSRCR